MQAADGLLCSVRWKSPLNFASVKNKKVNARSHHWLILRLLLKHCTYIFALQFVCTENSNPKIRRVLKSDHYLTKLEKGGGDLNQENWDNGDLSQNTYPWSKDLKSPTSVWLRQQRVRRWPKTQLTLWWTNVNSEKQGVVFKITPCHKFVATAFRVEGSTFYLKLFSVLSLLFWAFQKSHQSSI